MSKVLVTYFSASGVTAKTANKLAKEVDGDVFEIEPIKEDSPILKVEDKEIYIKSPKDNVKKIFSITGLDKIFKMEG